MRILAEQAGNVVKRLFELLWNFAGSMAAVCLFAAVLGLGIYHAMVSDADFRHVCYLGLRNPAGAFPPVGVVELHGASSPGVPHVRLEYGPGNRVLRVKSLNAEGRPCNLPGSQVAEQRLRYDARGHLVQKENFGALGAHAEDALGVSIRDFERDAAGRVVRITFRNAAGELTVPRFPGYAECRVQYDVLGRPLRVEYLDSAGLPVRNTEGESVVEYHYADDGSVVRSNYVDGVLADNYAGIARESSCMSESGICVKWTDAAGNAVLNPFTGAAVLLCETAREDKVKRRRFLEPDGTPRRCCKACAEHLVQLGKAGLPVWEFFGSADGLPVSHPVYGYAERLCVYSESGDLEREYFWDAQGRPARVGERRYVDSPAGRYTLTLHTDGSSCVQPE